MTPPGMALTVILRGASSYANWRQCDSRADFAAETGPYWGMILLEPEGAGRDPVALLVELIAAGMIYIVLLFACRHPLRQELARVAGILCGRR